MKTLIATTLLAALSAPAFADAPAMTTTAPSGETQTAAKTFTHNGQTYVYTTTQRGGQTIITGREQQTGEPFSFTVQGNRVSGYSNGHTVSFLLPRAW